MPAAKTKVPAFKLDSERKFFTDVKYDQAGSFGMTKLVAKYLLMHYTAGRGFKELISSSAGLARWCRW
jgi:hypothetical protein